MESSALVMTPILMDVERLINGFGSGNILGARKTISWGKNVRGEREAMFSMSWEFPRKSATASTRQASMGVSQSKPTKPQNPKLNHCSRAARKASAVKSKTRPGRRTDWAEGATDCTVSELTASKCSTA